MVGMSYRYRKQVRSISLKNYAKCRILYSTFRIVFGGDPSLPSMRLFLVGFGAYAAFYCVDTLRLLHPLSVVLVYVLNTFHFPTQTSILASRCAGLFRKCTSKQTPVEEWQRRYWPGSLQSHQPLELPHPPIHSFPLCSFRKVRRGGAVSRGGCSARARGAGHGSRGK